MARSLQNGDYRLLMVFESASRANSWYRVLRDGVSGALSCDCRAWIFNAQGRECVHTRSAARALQALGSPRNPLRPADGHPLAQAARDQWPGLLGDWAIRDQALDAEGKPYRMIALRLTLANGDCFTGAVAFAGAHLPTTASMVAGVAGWAGFGLAAEVARAGGFPMAGQPPEHFRAARGGRPDSGTAAGAGALGLADIMRVGERRNLGDGLTPAQRAENTLRLFLGPLYDELERQRFLDVSSQCHPGRVYRLRRDPAKQSVRRIRVFERGRYERDFCIVPAQPVPEADHWLTVFLGLLSDEQRTLQVVKNHNIFPPRSDGNEPEPLPAVWQMRVAA